MGSDSGLRQRYNMGLSIKGHTADICDSVELVRTTIKLRSIWEILCFQ